MSKFCKVSDKASYSAEMRLTLTESVLLSGKPARPLMIAKRYFHEQCT